MSDVFEVALEEDEIHPRRHRRHYKSEEVMRAECEQYVLAGKRLPKLHSRWLHNRYVNAGHSLQGLSTAHNYTLSQLEEAQATIKQLRQRIDELEAKPADQSIENF